jgi:putative copper resistance protein D
VAGFLDVVLRGLALAGQAMAMGGVLFALYVLRAATSDARAEESRIRRALLLIALGALGVIVAQALARTVQFATLADDSGWPLQAVFATDFFRATLLKAVLCLLILAGALALRRSPGRRGGWLALTALTALLAISAALTSHAAARLAHRAPLLAFDALHQLGAAVWVGGLIHLVAAVAPGKRQPPWPAALLTRFSAMSLTAVVILVTAGAGLSVYYIDGLRALVGTGYGLMVLTKVAILGALLGLGAINFFTVRKLPSGTPVPLEGLRRYVEVELGLGLTVLFAAASLTSLPPAVDVVADRATPAEVGTRFTPQWPRLSSPPIEALPVGDREAPRTDEDQAWSEYNHHVAGLFVLAMGLLVIMNRLGVGWARHWPLIFLGMAAFLLVRNDPGSWPLGPEGFWEGMTRPEVLQHRLFVVLVVGFGVFEWMVRTGRVTSPRCGLVFPILCAVGGVLLLTHSHASLNLKAEYLTEVTHAPLGVLALAAAWGRWLELRLPPAEGRLPGRIWATSLTLVGVLLLLYRES